MFTFDWNDLKAEAKDNRLRPVSVNFLMQLLFILLASLSLQKSRFPPPLVRFPGESRMRAKLSHTIKCTKKASLPARSFVRPNSWNNCSNFPSSVLERYCKKRAPKSFIRLRWLEERPFFSFLQQYVDI